MKTLVTLLTFGCLLLLSCRNSGPGPFRVIVTDGKGNALAGARVFLSYSSDPKPPEFVTNDDGFALIPESRARKGGWVSIIASYHDDQGIKHMGSLNDSKPKWPVTIQVAPR